MGRRPIYHKGIRAGVHSGIDVWLIRTGNAMCMKGNYLSHRYSSGLLAARAYGLYGNSYFFGYSNPVARD